ncbi:transcription elongation factor A protein 3 isoform X3 [Polypterus senegalus]|uniref:transcription elongation factor A protein 3 isoform X3 n=1 Tax=Polypterus senegalus TaxID=55291 RepID=UPI0019658CA3|nr:transcription elongation factor A protein 3 isoform X3 [Polypterus senegalus]
MTKEEELIRIAKKLDKMVSRSNMDGALDLLKELKGYNMTLKLLQSTRIGMSVNAVRKHCTDEEVITLAKMLIKNWKRLIELTHPPKEEREKDKEEEEKRNESHAPHKLPPHSSDKETRRESSQIKLDSDSPKKHAGHHESKRKPSHDSKSSSKCPQTDTKKQRKESSDSKSSSSSRRLSLDTKAEKMDSPEPKTSSSPILPKKLFVDCKAERRDSQSSQSEAQSPQPRKLSTESKERTSNEKSKPETPKSPTTPTSPGSPPFSPLGGAISPHLLTGNSIRDKCIEMLAAALKTEDTYKEYGSNCDSMASEIEDYIYQEIKAIDMKYKNRVRSRISNLKDAKNPNLRRNVLSGAIELSKFANMTAEEMASDEMKNLRNMLTQEAIREHQMAKTGGTATDLFQCAKCKKKNCTYNQVQTRSADEPMTTFVLCNECGNRWKFC